MEGSIQTLKYRAEEILEALTLDEKLGMIHGNELFKTKGVPHMGIPPLVMSDGPMGVRAEFHPTEWIPVGNTDDYVTYLPCNSAVAATWNRNLAARTGSVLGSEARGRRKDVILAPGMNLKRSPLCGRNFEYFSEDPYLTSELATEYVKGVQSWDVAVCLKHFALNHQETMRLEVDEEIDDEVLRDLYLQVFKDVIDNANPYSIMVAYNKLNGEYCSQSKYLLNDILRKEWGYEGFVVSDWGAVHDTVAAAEAEIDCEMSVTDDFDNYKFADPLKEKILSGEIDEALIDKKVIHILILMLRLNMLDEDVMIRKDASYNSFAARQDCLDIARGSVVLLKNEDNTLPLTRYNIKNKRILVIGENANRIHSNGGGSAEIKALYEISPLMGLKSRLGGSAEIDYLRGYASTIVENSTPNGTNWQALSLEDGGGKTAEDVDGSGSADCSVDASVDGNSCEDGSAVGNSCEDGNANVNRNADGSATWKNLAEYRKHLREEALAACEEYDHIIFVGGLNHDIDSEGIDRKNLDLPYEQNELLEALLEKRPDTIVAMVGGGAVDMTRWLDKCKALVWMYYNGMEGGNALAEVILGDINPCGHLPETFYCKAEDSSAISVGDFGDEKLVHYREGFHIGYRHIYKEKIPVQFPFGYGITYSDFEISNPSYNTGRHAVKGKLTNKSDVDGAEIIQVYRLPDEQHDYLELVGFDKVYLRANSEIDFEVNVRDRVGIGKYAVGFNSAELIEI
ncbi:glycoside hydrolase family 3 protein [Butyrivibrio sp. AC2005]|uniref:glycoside hydrolase family 3 protein n=1 Tax=Butyrivibrio sp. AC2005 TaxID=1280672 RepID=UPI000403274F|nr:glycoside hydrolase family 3 C-terminal domain-containing protein [Butyrivibrio sp. AC2005]